MAKSKKDIVRVRKLQFIAGQAKPGPSLAGVGINMPEFTRAFNDATRDRGKEPVPVEITVYKDKSFEFKLFTAPASYKLKEAAKIQKGSANSKTTIAATIKLDDLKAIAEYKLPDLNTDDIETAMSIIAGTAKNMGILIEGWDDVAAAKAAAKQAKKDELYAEQKEAELEAAQEEMNESKDKTIEVKTIDDEDEENEDEENTKGDK